MSLISIRLWVKLFIKFRFSKNEFTQHPAGWPLQIYGEDRGEVLTLFCQWEAKCGWWECSLVHWFISSLVAVFVTCLVVTWRR